MFNLSRHLKLVLDRSNSIILKRIPRVTAESAVKQTQSLSNMAFNEISSSASDNKRVLAIQSHVVHGYVGNKSATFPLQVLGFEVDAINSVQFSNHTGYKHIKGQVLNETEVADVFSGLQQNELLDAYTHLLTGYIGKDSFLREISSIVKALRSKNPNLVYVCDPVLGDDGHLYVPAELIPIYRDEIIPLSDICTPNQFEVELLSGITLKNESDAWLATNWFHDRGVKTVVISSSKFGADGGLAGFLSHKTATDRTKYAISIPIIGNGIAFTGTGDLFAALFLAHSHGQSDLGVAFEKTIATLQAVLWNTWNRIPEENRSPQKVTSRLRELKLIQSKRDIESPKVQLHAKKEVEILNGTN